MSKVPVKLKKLDSPAAPSVTVMSSVAAAKPKLHERKHNIKVASVAVVKVFVFKMCRLP